MKMKFEYLDHTADLKVRAYGETLEEAFINTALAGTNFLTDVNVLKKSIEKKIECESSNIESLLFDFLDELIFLTDTTGFMFSGAKNFKITKKKNSSYELKCTALGDHYKNYQMKGDVKAITYSEMKIEKKSEKYEITVVFDI